MARRFEFARDGPEMAKGAKGLFYQYGMGWGSWQPSAAMVGRYLAPPSVSSLLQGS